MLGNFIVHGATNPGTGDVILGTPIAPDKGYSSFASDGAPVYYVIQGTSGGLKKREAGYCNFDAGTPDKLLRSSAVVLDNSDGAATKINFDSDCIVYCEVPASKVVYQDQNGVAFSPIFRARSDIVGRGFCELDASDGTRPGFVAFYTSDNTRRGILGVNDGGTRLLLNAENGYTGFSVTGTFDVIGRITSTVAARGSGNAAAATLLGDFTFSNTFTPSLAGYTIFPHGLMLQWKYVELTTDGAGVVDTDISFPTAFPNQALHAWPGFVGDPPSPSVLGGISIKAAHPTYATMSTNTFGLGTPTTYSAVLWGLGY